MCKNEIGEKRGSVKGNPCVDPDQNKMQQNKG